MLSSNIHHQVVLMIMGLVWESSLKMDDSDQLEGVEGGGRPSPGSEKLGRRDAGGVRRRGGVASLRRKYPGYRVGGLWWEVGRGVNGGTRARWVAIMSRITTGRLLITDRNMISEGLHLIEEIVHRCEAVVVVGQNDGLNRMETQILTWAHIGLRVN